MNFPVIEIFHSIQGEGMYMGIPTFFVRVSGCNLRCVFKDSCCDTPYSSFDPEKSPYKSIDDVVDAFIEMYNKNPKTDRICITGGEPMLYQKGIDEFLTKVSDRCDGFFRTTIETNGTIDPSWLIEQLERDTNYYIELFSVSPKLSTSVDHIGKLTDEQREHHDKTRINIDALVKYVDYIESDTQLKFVYSGEECIQEIDDLLDKISDKLDLDKNYLEDRVYLMPEGTTVDQMNNKECVEKCIERGWKFAPRLHVIIWNDKRGV